MIMSKESLCQPYDEDGKRVKATKICMQCEERYCEACSNFHTVEKLTRNRKLQALDQKQCPVDGNAIENDDDRKSNSEEEYEESYSMPSISEIESSNKASDWDEFEEAVSSTTSLDLPSYQPSSPLVLRSEPTSVLLKVSPAENYKEDNSKYVHQMKKSSEERWQKYRDEFSCSDRELSVSGLVPNSLYSFRVKLIDEDSGDESQYSKGSDFISTDKTLVPGKPELVKSKVRSLFLRWSEVPGLTKDHSYELSYKCQQEGRWKNYKDTFPTGQESYEVSGLKPSSKYQFRVRVIDENGDEFPKSTISDILDTQKESMIPGKPFQVKVSKTSVKLRWDTKGIVLQNDNIFQLAYRSENFEQGHWNMMEQQMQDNECIVPSLSAGTDYTFKVRVFDKDSKIAQDYSESSDQIHTLEESMIPGKPIQVKVSQTSVKLRWDTKGIVLQRDNIFQLAYRSNNFEQDHWNIVEQQIKDNEYIVQSLFAGTDYTFKVRVFDKASRIAQDYSESSDQIHTLENTLTPGKPEAVTISHEYIELKWRLIHSPQEKDDTEYQVWYKNMSKKSGWKLYEECLSDPFISIVVKGLIPATPYVFKVRKVCIDTGEESDYSSTSEQIKTKEVIINSTSEQIKTKEGSDDVIFETFYHRSGKEIQCMYLNHTRFYLDDWGSKEWQPFPKRWYNEGLLVTNSVVKSSENATAEQEQEVQKQRRRQDQSEASGSNQPRRTRQTNTDQDDREGILNHPKKGQIPTYLFQRKHNVHCFYDHDQGQWVRMPIGYEMHHEMVGKLVDQIEEEMPHWGDRHDILALLRACNYDPDECITTYLNLDNDPWLKTARTSKEAKAAEQKDDTIETLQQQLEGMEEALKQERAAKQGAEKIVKEQTEKLSELEAENHQAQLMALKNARPKTPRPKTPQVVTKVVKEPTINLDDLDMLSNSAKELRKCHAQLKMQCQRNFDSIKDMMAKAVNGMRQIKSTSSDSMEEMEEVRALYRKEAIQRKLLYNQLKELRGNIRVFCRVRKDDRGQCCMKFLSDSDLMVMDQNQGKKMFSFDTVFDMKSTQEMIFDETKSIITSCVDGYNVCLMAYGQTGSGKTFTMMGPENNPGINIRAMKELFEVCKERVETITYSLRVSLIEIYNETIQDLLTSDAKTLELRTAGNKVNIPGLTDVEIKNLDDIKRTMKTGDKNRTTASTKMNSSSSRSHLLLMLAVEGRDKVTGAISKGTLTLCDLAGSERMSKTEAEGQRLMEAAAINKSLSALGQVFTGLRTSQLHVPYRNSKLTQILQPSLSGDAKACLFVNCSPDVSNYSETVSTLTFGSNAKQVALGQAKQEIKKGLQ